MTSRTPSSGSAVDVGEVGDDGLGPAAAAPRRCARRRGSRSISRQRAPGRGEARQSGAGAAAEIDDAGAGAASSQAGAAARSRASRAARRRRARRSSQCGVEAHAPLAAPPRRAPRSRPSPAAPARPPRPPPPPHAARAGIVEERGRAPPRSAAAIARRHERAGRLGHQVGDRARPGRRRPAAPCDSASAKAMP